MSALPYVWYWKMAEQKKEEGRKEEVAQNNKELKPDKPKTH